MGLPRRVREPGEAALLRGRAHGRALVGAALAAVAVPAVTVYAAGRAPDVVAGVPLLSSIPVDVLRLAVGLAGVVVLGRLAVVPWLRWRSRTWVLTDRRVLVLHHRRLVDAADLAAVTDVQVVRRGLDVLFGSAAVEVGLDDGREPLVLVRVPDAAAVAGLVRRRCGLPAEPAPPPLGPPAERLP